jgi:uncharacterized protein (DUF362 family)
MDVDDELRINRREFFKRLATGTLAGGAILAGANVFRDRHPIPPVKEALRIKPFSVGGMDDFFYIVRGKDPGQIVRKAVESAGGMSRFVSKGDRVLLKVNCAFARSAWMGATTSPEVTAEVVKLCLSAGAKSVRVTDFPINDPKNCFYRSEIGPAVKAAGGEILLPSPDDFKIVRVSNGVIGNWEVFYTPLAWCDKIIGIPTVKSHNLSLASLGMKNWYGFIGGSRNRFHQNIHEVIAELGAFITPTLMILDGTRILMRNGPTGGSADDVKEGNVVAVSNDQVAIDAFGSELLGLEKTAVPYLALAEKMSVGKSSYRTFKAFKEMEI